jgi:hypothetical protein
MAGDKIHASRMAILFVAGALMVWYFVERLVNQSTNL